MQNSNKALEEDVVFGEVRQMQTWKWTKKWHIVNVGHVDFGSRARSIKILSQQLQQNVISNVLSKSIKSAATCHLECFITNPWVEKSAFKNLGNQYFRDMFRCVSIVIKLEGWCYLYGSSEMYFSVMLSCISLFAYLEVVLVVRGVARHFLFLYSPTISPPRHTHPPVFLYLGNPYSCVSQFVHVR